MIATSMAGAGQLVAGSVDPVHLVALAFDGHGVPVSSRRAPAVPGGHGTRTSRDLDGLVRSCCWPGGTVEQLQVIASSMAGAGQLVAGSVDLVHLVALVLDGHGVPVSSRRAPAVPVATVPGQVVIWMVWCASAAGPGGTVEQLQVIAASMAGAGQLVAGSVDPVYLVALGVVQPPDSASHPPDRAAR